MEAEERRKQYLHTTVVDILHASLVRIAGRELLEPNSTTTEDHEHNQCVLLQQWRTIELRRLVAQSVTIRDPTIVLQQAARSRMYDIEIRTATSFFHRYKQTLPAKTTNRDSVDDISASSSSSSSQSQQQKYCVTLVSELGVVRQCHSSYQLASWILTEIEDECQGKNIASYLRVAHPSGFVCLATPYLLEQLERQHPGWQPCPTCPVWCQGGSKGLWWHLQQQHHKIHSDASEWATWQCHKRHLKAMIVFNPNQQKDVSNSVIKFNDNVVSSQPLSNPVQSMLLQTNKEDPWSCVKRGGTVDELIRTLDIHCPTFDCTMDRDRHGAPLLLWAAGGGHLTLVRYLVEHRRCDPDQSQTGKRAYMGRTSLHWAARNGHALIVQYLLSYTTETENDHTILDHRREAITADGTNAFCWAAWQSHMDVMELLHAHECHIDRENTFGCNAVLWAAQGKGNPVTIQWLENVGCPIYTVNHTGHGLLHKAAQRGRHDLSQWYLQDRILPWLKNGASHAEKNALNFEIVFRLIGPDTDGCTPSDLAGAEDHKELAVYLAQQEMAIVKAIYQMCLLNESIRPEWLRSSAGSVSFAGESSYIWEPWAGVRRMQHVMSRLLE